MLACTQVCTNTYTQTLQHTSGICTVLDVLGVMLQLAVSTLSNGLTQSPYAIYKHISMWTVTWESRKEREMKTNEGGSVREDE